MKSQGIKYPLTFSLLLLQLDLMKVWITRPCMWDLIVKGIQRCELWIEKPYYDPTPNGIDEELEIFRSIPYGWATEYDGHRNKYVHSFDLRKWFIKEYQYLGDYLWEEICLDVDECLPGDIEQPYTRWAQRQQYERYHQDNENDLRESSTFLLELDIPPELWWRIAFSESDDNCRDVKQQQAWFWNDIPF